MGSMAPPAQRRRLSEPNIGSVVTPYGSYFDHPPLELTVRSFLHYSRFIKPNSLLLVSLESSNLFAS